LHPSYARPVLFFCVIKFAPMFDSISPPMQRGLEQRQFDLQHAPPGPKIHQLPEPTHAGAANSNRKSTGVPILGVDLFNFHALSRPRLDEPMQPQFSFLCALDPPPKGPTALTTKLGDFKPGSLFSALARSPSYHGGPPPECLARRTLHHSTSPTCSSLLVLRPLFVPYR
jgi:hypothetical protein